MKFAEYLIQSLQAKGVRHFFHLPGSAVIPLFNYLAPEACILMKSPLNVGFAADAYARINDLSVSIVAQGPGILDILPALAMSKRDHVATICITAKPDYLQDNPNAWQAFPLHKTLSALDIDCVDIEDVRDAELLVRQVIDLATAPIPTPVVLNCLHSVFEQEMPEPQFTEAQSLTPPAHYDLDPIDINDTCNLLKHAKRPVFLYGRGALGAADLIRQLAEETQIPVVTTIPGRGIVDEHLDYCFGPVGSVGFSAANQVLLESDLIIAIGTILSNTTMHVLLTAPEVPKIVHVVPEFKDVCRTLPVSLHCYSLAGPFISALLAHHIAKNPWKKNAPAIVAEGSQMTLFMKALIEHIGNDYTVCLDAGLSCVVAHWCVRCEQPFKLLFGWGIASMGYSLPSAIAAAVSGRTRVVAVVGDGGLYMSLGDLATIVDYQLPVTIVVFNNHAQGFIKMLSKPTPHFDFSPTSDFTQLGAAFGIPSLKVETVIELTAALKTQTPQNTPQLIEISMPFEAINLGSTQWRVSE